MPTHYCAPATSCPSFKNQPARETATSPVREVVIAVEKARPKCAARENMVQSHPVSLSAERFHVMWGVPSSLAITSQRDIDQRRA